MTTEIAPRRGGPTTRVTAHPAEVEGWWWLAASTADGAARVGIRSGSARFTITPARRLMFDCTLTTEEGRTRTIHGIAAARATPAGLFAWRGRRFAVLAAWFRWGYRLSTDGRMLVIEHPGSIATQQRIFLMCRENVDATQAAGFLLSEVSAGRMTPSQVDVLSRHSR